MKSIISNLLIRTTLLTTLTIPNINCHNNEIIYLKRKLEMLEEKVSNNKIIPVNLTPNITGSQRCLEWTFEKDSRTVTGRTVLHNFDTYRDQYRGILCSSQYKDKYITELSQAIIKELYIDSNGTKDLAVFDGYHLDYFLKIQISKEPSYLWIREF